MNKKDFFTSKNTYKLYREVGELLHPVISKKNISNYKIVFEDESEFWTLFTLSMIGIELMTILRHNYTAARVEYYFTYFFMLFLPMCIERFFNKKSKYIAYGGTIAILLILFYIRI